jgi:nitrate/TMAO reductase-like tetraheme cytochrome c subunit
MSKFIRDQYELPDDGDDDGYGGIAISTKLGWGFWLPIVLIVVITLGMLIYGTSTISAREKEDEFCVSCHTVPETTYHRRAQAAVAGTVAVDLSSFHYQQIRGKGGDIRCIDCHLGDRSTSAQAQKWAATSRHAIIWLVGRNITDTENLRLRVPTLTNDSCINCHRDTILTVGTANHLHNTLPVAYDLWKNGAKLVLPSDARDPQALLAPGLARYETTVTCVTCHQTHRTIEKMRFLDNEVIQQACQKCHLQAGRGPK